MKRTWAVKSSDLTVEQQKAIQLDSNGSYAIFGPPGSGKTNVLLLRAKYLISKFPNRTVLCLVFTSALKEFIKNGLKEYKLEESFVQTFHGWGLNRLKDTGIEVNSFDEIVPKLKAQNTQGKLIKFDYLLVDESQDFSRETIELFFEIATNVHLFFDKNQTIYQSIDNTVDVYPISLRSVKSKFKEEIELPKNFRVPFKIAQLAASVVPTSNLTTNTVRDDRGDFPIYKVFQNLNDELKFVKSRIEDIPNENPDYNIVILEKTNKVELEKTFESFRQLGLETETIIYGYPRCNFDNTIPKLLTLHSVKGLEFDVVFLIKATPLSFPGYLNDKSLAFVGITRARSRVYITAVNAISEVYCPPQKAEIINKVTLEDLFD